nr:dnaJ domain containing protein 7 [Dermatophagoides farinae]
MSYDFSNFDVDIDFYSFSNTSRNKIFLCISCAQLFESVSENSNAFIHMLETSHDIFFDVNTLEFYSISDQTIIDNRPYQMLVDNFMPQVNKLLSLLIYSYRSVLVEILFKSSDLNSALNEIKIFLNTNKINFSELDFRFISQIHLNTKTQSLFSYTLNNKKYISGYATFTTSNNKSSSLKATLYALGQVIPLRVLFCDTDFSELQNDNSSGTTLFLELALLYKKQAITNSIKGSVAINRLFNYIEKFGPSLIRSAQQVSPYEYLSFLLSSLYTLSAKNTFSIQRTIKQTIIDNIIINDKIFCLKLNLPELQLSLGSQANEFQLADIISAYFKEKESYPINVKKYVFIYYEYTSTANTEQTHFTKLRCIYNVSQNQDLLNNNQNYQLVCNVSLYKTKNFNSSLSKKNLDFINCQIFIKINNNWVDVSENNSEFIDAYNVQFESPILQVWKLVT